MKDLNKWATMPTQKSNPLAVPHIAKQGADSGYDVLNVIRESQQRQAADTVKAMAAHFMSQVPDMESKSDSERDKMMTDFLGKLREMMENDTSDFRHFVESYMTDFSKGSVAEENKLSHRELHQMGALSTKGTVLKSAGMRIASNIHKLDPSRKQLGLYDTTLFDTKEDAPKGVLGKAYEKTKGFRNLFKQEESVEGEKVPKFDEKKFKEDELYHKKMLEYTKDLRTEAHQGNLLSKGQQKLLKTIADKEKLQHFIDNPEARMTPGEKLAYTVMTGLGKGAYNAFKNVTKKKDVEPIKEDSIEEKAVETVKSNPEVIKTATESKPAVEKLSKEKTQELVKDKYKFNPDTNRWHDVESNKMIKAATVSGYAKEQQSNEEEHDNSEQDKLESLLEKIEKNTDPENIKNKKPDEASSSILDKASDILVGGGIIATITKLLNPVTKVVAAGAAGYAAGTALYDNSETVRNIGDSAMEAIFGHIDTTAEMDEKRTQSAPVKRKDIYEGRKRIIDLSEAESIKKSNADKLAASDAKVDAAKESKEAAKIVQNTTNSPSTTTNVVSGGNSNTFVQNVRNPDSSYNKWLDSRVAYA
jgi:hypothetical protein